LFAEKQKEKSSSHPGQKVLLAPLFVKGKSLFGHNSSAELQSL
jgi:hypothetical protein